MKPREFGRRSLRQRGIRQVSVEMTMAFVDSGVNAAGKRDPHAESYGASGALLKIHRLLWVMLCIP